MKNTFAIGIPTLNRADLLIPTLEKYIKDFPNTKIYILDNGNQEEISHKKNPHPVFDNINILRFSAEKNLGVAASWNLLCKWIFIGNDFAIIMNDDIYWGANEKEVDEHLTKYERQRFFSNPVDWCNFIIPKKTFRYVGEFDESFYPAYCEDNDYAYRMKLSGIRPYKTTFLLPSVHRASQTLEKDSSISLAYVKNKKKYIEKWGGEPDFERFATPFNKI